MVLRDVSTIDVNYVKKLYREAFPLRERIPFSKLLKLQKNGIIRILAAYENGEPCGVAVACTGSKSVLLMYLAVDGNKRGQGLGSKIMPALCDTFPRRNLLLEIEKPDESKPMTVRRKEFYLRCGLHDAGVDILLAGVPMEILMTGDGEFDKYEYIGIYHKSRKILFFFRHFYIFIWYPILVLRFLVYSFQTRCRAFCTMRLFL